MHLYTRLHMHRSKTLLILLTSFLACQAAEFSGQQAFDYTAKTVDFGARTPGSELHASIALARTPRLAAPGMQPGSTSSNLLEHGSSRIASDLLDLCRDAR